VVLTRYVSSHATREAASRALRKIKLQLDEMGVVIDVGRGER